MSEAASEPDPLDALAEAFLEECRLGLTPSVSEYARRHPELAERIRDLFPALLALEGVQPGAGPQPDAPAGRPPPERLGEYRLLRELGRGGMGVVYEAVHETLGRHVALKVLPFNELADPIHLERFRREARAAAKLHHTNIVPVFDVGQHAGIHYFAMQFIRGQSLEAVLREVRRLREPRPVGPGDPTPRPPGDATASLGATANQPAGATSDPGPPGESELSTQVHGRYYRSVARLGVQAAEALQYAHLHGILHRDIKPANLLLDPEGTLWVADFGLAKAQDGDGLTDSGALVGTLRFMAPERFAGQADARSDVYSLGVTLYELLTLRPAFDAADRAGLIERIVHEDPVPPRRLDRRIPRDLETVVLKAMAREPSARYTSAAELAGDLQRFLDDRPVRARRTRPWERLAKWVKRRPMVATLLALLAVSLGVLLGTMWLHTQELERERDQVKAKAAEAKAAGKRAEDNFGDALAAVDQALTRVGDRSFEDSPQKVKRQLYEDALRLCQRLLARKRNDPTTLRKVALITIRLAEARAELGELGLALAEAREASTIARRLAAQYPGRPEFRHLLGVMVMTEGGVFYTTRHYAEAEATYRQSLELHRRLADEYPREGKYRRAAGRVLVALAVTLQERLRLPEAEKTFLEAEATLRPLTAAPHRDVEATFARAQNLDLLGKLYALTGRRTEAERRCTQAVRILEKCPDDPGTRTVIRRKLAGAYFNLGMVQANGPRAAGAETAFRKAQGHFAKLAADNPAYPDYRRRRAKAHIHLYALLGQTGRLPEAEKELRQGVGLLESLVGEFPDHAEYREDLSNAYLYLARTLKAAGARADAQGVYRKVIPLIDRLAADFPGRFELPLEAAAARADLGLLLGKEQAEEARAAYREALALEGKLAPRADAHHKQRGRWIDLSFLLGELAATLGDLKEARRLLERTVDLQLARKPEERSPGYAGELRADYHELLAVLHRLGDHAGAARRARELPKHFPGDIVQHIQAGAALTQCALQAEKDAKLPEGERRALARSYADQAVELIRTALRLGGADPRALRRNILQGIRRHADPAALRAYPGYRELLTELEADAPPSP
jgi:serine/threonine protein kinase